MHLFIFPNIHSRINDSDKIKLNIENDTFTFFYNDKKVIVDTSVLRDGSSTLILYNQITENLYPLYNFRELLQIMDMTPMDFTHNLGQKGFIQIDKCSDDLFIKVFLFKGDFSLDSDTNDFSNCRHYTIDYIHALDWQYSWLLDNIEGYINDGILHLEFDTHISDFWKRDIYCNHAGQSVKLNQGHNIVEVKYVPTNNVYIGEPNCRYVGRTIDIERLINDNKVATN